MQGDRSAAKAPGLTGGGRRQVTLIQAEHLPVVAALSGLPDVPAGWLRRNLVISGLNRQLWPEPAGGAHAVQGRAAGTGIGAFVGLSVSGPCEPCSRMEEMLGAGGYHVMRGHRRLTARALVGGPIALGDEVHCAPPR